MACNRPFEYDTLPLVLLYEAFGMFKDRCNAAPSERALVFLNELTVAACEWFPDENQRRATIRSLFQERLNIRFHEEKVPNTEYTTVGNFMAIFVPDESGYALNQAILYYSRFLCELIDDHRRLYNFKTCFPCILMVDMGMSVL